MLFAMETVVTPGRVEAVSAGRTHRVAKINRVTVRLLAGVGVEGDVHAGATVQHRSRARREPAQPNLRQVHLIEAELHDELRAAGFTVGPGQMGENITTRGIDLRALPAGARLQLGGEAVVELTGLRTPCRLLDTIDPRLMETLFYRDENGEMVRKAGVMAVVVSDGWVCPGDAITAEIPRPPHRPLPPV